MLARNCQVLVARACSNCLWMVLYVCFDCLAGPSSAAWVAGVLCERRSPSPAWWVIISTVTSEPDPTTIAGLVFSKK
jgi:hypothetical protein